MGIVNFKYDIQNQKCAIHYLKKQTMDNINQNYTAET